MSDKEITVDIIRKLEEDLHKAHEEEAKPLSEKEQEYIDALYALYSVGPEKMRAYREKWGERIEQLQPYRVTSEVMAMARPGAILLHCLPSFHDLNTSIARDVHEKFGISEMEVTDEVFNSEKSLVFEQAENRMHTIKAVIFLTLWKKEEQ